MSNEGDIENYEIFKTDKISRPCRAFSSYMSPEVMHAK